MRRTGARPSCHRGRSRMLWAWGGAPSDLPRARVMNLSDSGHPMRRLPPLNALQIFETVARHRSFTRAADHLCLTQGAVSRQILALEDYYKFPLFKRQAKGLTLTAEGELLLPAVK